MTIGTDLAYNSAGLRAGASGLREVVGHSETAMSTLRGAPLLPGMFGLTDAAAVYAAVIESVRAARVHGLHQEGERAGDLAGRSDTAGGLGDGLTAETARVAGSVTAR